MYFRYLGKQVQTIIILIRFLGFPFQFLFSFSTRFWWRNAQNAFYKVLLANAATSALRLHQRMPRLQFTREYFALLLVEDSCHYLFFSTIFLYVSPFILILLPVVLFAILHAASYSLTLLDVSALQIPKYFKLNSLIQFNRLFHCFSLATWTKFVVGCPIDDFTCWTSNIKHLALGRAVRNSIDATRHHLCIHWTCRFDDSLRILSFSRAQILISPKPIQS